MMKNRLKNRYLQTIGCTAIVLSLVRCAFPGIAGSLATSPAASAPSETAEADTLKVKSVAEAASPGTAYLLPAYGKSASTRYVAEGRQHHRIVSVANYNEAFPDRSFKFHKTSRILVHRLPPVLPEDYANMPTAYVLKKHLHTLIAQETEKMDRELHP